MSARCLGHAFCYGKSTGTHVPACPLFVEPAQAMQPDRQVVIARVVARAEAVSRVAAQIAIEQPARSVEHLARITSDLADLVADLAKVTR